MKKSRKIFLLVVIGMLFIAILNLPKEIERRKKIAEQPDVQKKVALASSPVEATLVDFIKKTTRSTDVQLFSQAGTINVYLAEIRIAKDPFMAGQSDWNMVAGETFYACKDLLNNDGILRLHFIYYSPQNNNINWAHVMVDKRKLPSNWKDSYLLFFSACNPYAGTMQSTKWLCDFYKKYQSARPDMRMPEYCSPY